MIITSDYGSFPHSLSLAPVSLPSNHCKIHYPIISSGSQAFPARTAPMKSHGSCDPGNLDWSWQDETDWLAMFDYWRVYQNMDNLSLSHDGSMVLLYMVTWIPSIYPKYVSIYTSTMDPMGILWYQFEDLKDVPITNHHQSPVWSLW